MPNSPKVDINEVVDQFSSDEPTRDIYAFLGVSKRGKVNDPSDIISSWPQFQKLFGGLVPAGNDDPFLIKRHIERGGKARFSKMGHYTDITNPNTLDAVLATNAISKLVTLSGPLAAGHVMETTVNGTSYTQAFTTDSLTTLQLLAAKINAGAIGVVQTAKALTNLKLEIVPVTGVVLVVTSVPTGAGAPAGVATSVSTHANTAGIELFDLQPKYPGLDYNNVIKEIVFPSVNGDPNAFDINITHIVEGDPVKETYRGLKIVGNPTVANSNYLDTIVKSSYLVKVVYKDLSALVGQVTPVASIVKFSGGTDGSALTTADYIGNSNAHTGFYSYIGKDDFGWLTVLNRSDISILNAGSAYAAARKDIEFHAHLSNASITEDALIADRDALTIDDSYTRLFAGGLKVADPFTGGDKFISEQGDVAGIVAYSSQKFGRWYSSSGTRRGIITNALDIMNNFGALSNYDNLNRLANRQINTVINRDGKLYLSGNFTALKTPGASPLKWANVRGMLLYVKKLLYPIYNTYLDEPNDFTTWRTMYTEVKPQLEALKSKRAIRDYDYQGDQFINKPAEMLVNNQADVDNGIYVVKLYVKEIVALNFIQVNVTLSPSGVSFEEVLNNIQ